MKNVISCSRRTDVPKFYYPWLQECLKKGYCTVTNPYNNKQSKVDLTKDNVAAIVLWSKDFSNVLNDPGELVNYNLYFQYTITMYDTDLEQAGVPYHKTLETLKGLMKTYKAEQFNIRYDPIIFTEKYNMEERLSSFETLCKDLVKIGMGDCRITTSYISLYGKVKYNLRRYGVKPLEYSEDEICDFFSKLGYIAYSYGFQLYSCSNPVLEKCELIKKSHCIDGDLLTSLFKDKVTSSKDNVQRKSCGCIKSRDIGSYIDMNCGHKCLYCYANADI